MSVLEQHPLKPDVPNERWEIWEEVDTRDRERMALRAEQERIWGRPNMNDRDSVHCQMHLKEIEHILASLKRRLFHKLRQTESDPRTTNDELLIALSMAPESGGAVVDPEARIASILSNEQTLMENFFEDLELCKRMKVKLEESFLQQAARIFTRTPKLSASIIREKHPYASDQLIVQWEIEELQRYRRLVESGKSTIHELEVTREWDMDYLHDQKHVELQRIDRAIERRTNHLTITYREQLEFMLQESDEVEEGIGGLFKQYKESVQQMQQQCEVHLGESVGRALYRFVNYFS